MTFALFADFARDDGRDKELGHPTSARSISAQGPRNESKVDVHPSPEWGMNDQELLEVLPRRSR